ncbi:Gfo/Idh/MocA family protein [Spirochaeta dissipatitropha]
MQQSTAEQKQILLVGAGNRGRVYSDALLGKASGGHKSPARVCAVAEPIEQRRRSFATRHHIPADHCFSDYKEAADACRRGSLHIDAVILATGDHEHVEPALAFLELNTHILLEKPMAVRREDIRKICEAADASKGSLSICHVLRYSPFFQTLKSVVDSGILGQIASMYYAENVAWYHFVHSYVRGNWRDSESSSPLILAKSCHDLDIIQWLMDSPPTRISSSAQRRLFIEQAAPPGSAGRCTDGCRYADSCPYEAERTYLHGIPLKQALSRSPGFLGAAAGFSLKHPAISRKIPGLKNYHIWKEWPTSTISDDLSHEGISRALREGPYGVCAWKTGGNQPEHQETLIDFASGATAVFRLHGLSHEEGRSIRIDGSLASLRGKFGSGSSISIHHHHSGQTEELPVHSDFIGHSEADTAIVENWVKVLAGAPLTTSARESALSHIMAFAADESVQQQHSILLEDLLRDFT